MQEIRNVVRSPDDIERLWPGARSENLNVLIMDVGQAFVVEAFAHVPTVPKPTPQVPAITGFPSATVYAPQGPTATSTFSTVESVMDVGYAATTPTTAESAASTSAQEPTAATPGPLPFMNLAVNQKVVYQPTFRFRRWLNEEKGIAPDGESDSVATIESRLPPLRGPSASVCSYVEELSKVEARLQGKISTQAITTDFKSTNGIWNVLVRPSTRYLRTGCWEL